MLPLLPQFVCGMSNPPHVRIVPVMVGIGCDIMGLFDNSGSVVVEYTYGAWGNILSTLVLWQARLALKIYDN
jgi:hypothetical protein